MAKNQYLCELEVFDRGSGTRKHFNDQLHAYSCKASDKEEQAFLMRGKQMPAADSTDLNAHCKVLTFPQLLELESMSLRHVYIWG